MVFLNKPEWVSEKYVNIFRSTLSRVQALLTQRAESTPQIIIIFYTRIFYISVKYRNFLLVNCSVKMLVKRK